MDERRSYILRLPKSLHMRLKVRAAHMDISMNQIINEAIQEKLRETKNNGKTKARPKIQ